MEDRKGDNRIYIITGLFLACIISGGIFLCLYIILPETESAPWYPIAGMTLVAIPWVSWFLIYLYQCFKPMDVQYDEHQNQGKGAGTPKAVLTSGATTTVSSVESPVKSPAGGDGGHHVHFGPVVVMGNGGGGGDGGQRRQEAAMDHHQEDFDYSLPHNDYKEIPSSR